LVDADRIQERLGRLEHLVERLEVVRAAGENAYLADEDVRAMTERWLQLAIQICIDVGAQLVSELPVAPPTDYGGVFRALAAARVLDPSLAERLALAAGQRNLLVHAYLDLDDHLVFVALQGLDDFRAFAAEVASAA
jgi:uncharacterized protein YutE (UPF0331/DUF86 family)